MFGQNDANIRFCRRSSSCHPCSPGAESAQSRGPPTSGTSFPPAVQTGGPQKTSRDYSHDFCCSNISLYTSSWSLWETHSFIMKTYEVILWSTYTVDGIIENVSKSPPPDMQKRCTWFEALGSPLYPPCFLSGWTSDVHHPAWLRTTWLLTNLWSLWYFEMLKPSSIFWSWGR